MDSTAESFSPMIMLQVMHMCFPRFAEKSEHGGYEQQVCMESAQVVRISYLGFLPFLCKPVMRSRWIGGTVPYKSGRCLDYYRSDNHTQPSVDLRYLPHTTTQ